MIPFSTMNTNSPTQKDIYISIHGLNKLISPISICIIPNKPRGKEELVVVFKECAYETCTLLDVQRCERYVESQNYTLVTRAVAVRWHIYVAIIPHICIVMSCTCGEQEVMHHLLRRMKRRTKGKQPKDSTSR